MPDFLFGGIKIFAVINITGRKKFFYKVRGTEKNINGIKFLSVYAPEPKNQKNIKHLSEVLKPYCGKIILPVKFENMPVISKWEYDTLHFERRVLISAFMDYCREERPKNVAVIGSGVLTPDFFADLSRYAECITLPTAEYNEELLREVLNVSGTPLMFGDIFDNCDVALLLKNYPGAVLPRICCPVFKRDIFKEIKVPEGNVVLRQLQDFDPLKVSAAMFGEYGLKNVFDFWKTLVIKKNVIYNIL